MALLACLGCGGKKPPVKGASEQTPEKKPAGPPQVVNLLRGSVYYANTKNDPLFKIFFESGQASMTPEAPAGDSAGVFKGVSGMIFQGTKTASKFRADTGQGDQKSQILTLSDHVVVTSADPEATMQCDRMVYDGKKKLIRAIGNVRVTGTMSTQDAIKELWATPDLKKIATPEMFAQP